jgi:hypothetical protein
MHHFQTNLEACTTELGIELLDMSAKCVEFVKRGRKEYKVLEAIVKRGKAKAVEVALITPTPPDACSKPAYITSGPPDLIHTHS